MRLDRYTYVKALSGDHFALWWQEKNGSGRGVQFRVYDSAVLHQIHIWRSESAGAKDNLIGATEISGFAIPSTIDDGLNRVILPQEFSQDAETLDAAGLNRSD